MSPFDPAPFVERRQRFAAAIGDALAIVPGAGKLRRNGDVHYEFRQASDFFFLTGFDEPDAVAVFNPADAKERFVLFVRPRDREMEIWNGRRAGVEGAIATYGADAAYTIDRLDDKLREYMLDRPAVFYRLGSGSFDGRVTRLVADLRAARARGHAAPVRIEDPGPILHELRLRRSPAELQRHRRACEISRDAHIEAMRYARPGLYEYQVQAALEYVFRVNGSPRNGYPSIVASGPNACILHYNENTRRMEDGDLLLIDAGCEWGYHSADITRTFPVNGRFTAAQRAVYEVVLRAQLAGIAAARPGNRYEAIHEAARRVLAEGLVALGALPRGARRSRSRCTTTASSTCTAPATGSAWTCTTSATTRSTASRASWSLAWCSRWSPASTSTPIARRSTYHLREYSEDEMWERRLRLGAAAAKKMEEEEKAKAETVVHPVPRELRGIGIRIEDDVLITPDGCDVLTAGTPKTVAEVERACAEPPRLPRA